MEMIYQHRDNWCICVYRWYQAKTDGTAPRIVSAATNQAALSYFEKFNLSISEDDEFESGVVIEDVELLLLLLLLKLTLLLE